MRRGSSPKGSRVSLKKFCNLRVNWCHRKYVYELGFETYGLGLDVMYTNKSSFGKLLDKFGLED